VSHRGERPCQILFLSAVLTLLHFENILQIAVLWAEDWMGKVIFENPLCVIKHVHSNFFSTKIWIWNLHVIDLIKVGAYTFIYTLPHTLIRSNDYSRNVTSSPWKAMILNNVVVGKGYKITNDNSSLTGPPPGYDSVSLFEFRRFDQTYLCGSDSNTRC